VVLVFCLFVQLLIYRAAFLRLARSFLVNNDYLYNLMDPTVALIPLTRTRCLVFPKESCLPHRVFIMDVMTDYLMKPSDELIWQHEGLFDKVDAFANRQSTNLNIPSAPAVSPLALVPSPLTETCAQPVPDRPPPTSFSSPLTARVTRSSLQDTQRVPLPTNTDPHSRKVWKASRKSKRLVLGDGVGLEDLCKMSTSALVGRVSYKSLSSQPLEEWIKSSWLPLLGYTLEVLFLKKGWLCFICKSPDDASLLLSSFWT
jgi:hypothetical protein